MRVVDSSTGKRVHDADIQVVDTKLGFNFGSAILQNILNNQPYQVRTQDSDRLTNIRLVLVLHD